jgi:hypothetical protein
MLMQLTIPVEAGNEAGRWDKISEDSPSSATLGRYFDAGPSGERGGFVVFDLKDTSQIPGKAEQFFLGYNAKVTFLPVMNAEDLAKAIPGIEKAVKEHAQGASA